MNRTFKIICFTLAFLCLGAGRVPAGDTAGYWKETIATNDLPQIAVLMAGGKRPWPKIVSLQAIEAMPKEERAVRMKDFEAAELLFDKIREYEKGTETGNPGKIGPVVDTYSRLAGALEKGGGYTNYLLADTSARLATRYISIYLVQNSNQYKEAKKMIDGLGMPLITNAVISQVIVDEGIYGADDMKIKEINKTDSIHAVLFQILGYKLDTDFVQRVGRYANTSILIDERHVDVLFVRMASTEGNINVKILGFIEFLKRGGDSSYMGSDKKKDFWSLIDKETLRKFNNEFPKFNRLKRTHVKYIYNELGNSEKEPIFYKLAIE